jgi:hypothetical protein
MRTLIMLLALGAVTGCKRDAVRELVEKDTDGSPAAVAACLSRGDLPRDTCQRVAEHDVARVLAMESPNRLACGDAMLVASRWAYWSAKQLAEKCCKDLRELATDVREACVITMKISP